MKNIKSIASLIVTSLLLVACDGDPGPQGPQGDVGIEGSGSGYVKRGYFEGTISGVRKDGTPFSEPFNYRYTNDAPELFTHVSGTSLAQFTVLRQQSTNNSLGYITLDFVVLNEGTSDEKLVLKSSSQYTPPPVSFLFKEELSPGNLFDLQTYSYVAHVPFVRPISRDQNVLYGFQEDPFGDVSQTNYYDSESAQNVYYFVTSAGVKVYFEDLYTRYSDEHNYYYGAFLKMVSPEGDVSTTSPLYSQLHLGYNESYRVVFRSAQTGEYLSEVISDIDEYQVTNYVHDASTGVISFDFTITIGVYGSYNPTRNPITITGKYNSGHGIYSEVVGRVR